jgi:multidrug resistance efflux pump
MEKIIKAVIAGMFLFSCGSDKEAKSDLEQASNEPVEVNRVMGIAEIEPLNRITQLSSEVSGRIKSIEIVIGERVQENSIVLTLDSDNERAIIDQGNARINTQTKVVESLNTSLEVLKNQLAKAKRDYARNESLYNGKAITKEALENSQFEISNLEKQIEAQRSNITEQESRIPEIKADVSISRINLSKKTVRAPVSGTLLSLDVSKGEYLSLNQLIGEFAPDGPIMALTEIDELFADKVELGQRAVIKSQGSDEILARGKVVLMSPYLRKKSLFSENSSNLEDRRVREVRVELDSSSNVLIGSRVECWIEVKQ